ncbi:hypothetical protein [Verrucomicrobium sp. GAS474]|uniref:hypothetical protein n=1 Tax=Verrucomicrobium sp. GAS474 TaxID=1882831 RepID=UPI000B895371|nr:hypothetical protein [Verrucomicrobium sp. GAS474]
MTIIEKWLAVEAVVVIAVRLGQFARDRWNEQWGRNVGIATGVFVAVGLGVILFAPPTIPDLNQQNFDGPAYPWLDRTLDNVGTALAVTGLAIVPTLYLSGEGVGSWLRRRMRGYE